MIAKSIQLVFLAIVSVSSQDISYGLRLSNFPSAGLTGSTGRIGYSSVPSPSGSTGVTSRGRVINNSILDLDEPHEMELENENIQINFRPQPQPSPFPAAIMARPIPVMTGPGPDRTSVASGQMMGTDNGLTSVSMEDRTPTINPSRPAMIPSRNEPVDASSMHERTVHRYVSVHVPPPEPMRTSRILSGQSNQKSETHYQIMFIKAPTATPQELQEIQMPPPPQMKTLVYVLLKKPEANDFIKIAEPPKIKPTKPEVFFIQYKGDKSKKQTPQQKGPMMSAPVNGSDNDNGVSSSSSMGMGMGYSTQSTSRPKTTSTTTRQPSTSAVGMVQQHVEDFGTPEIADSDFSHHDRFNQNAYPLSSYQRHNMNPQKLRTGFSYSPATSHYRIVS